MQVYKNKEEYTCEDCYLGMICSIREVVEKKGEKRCREFKLRIPFYKWGIVWDVDEKIS